MTGLNFTSIDFETANDKNTSACSLGLVKVVDGVITESHEWLIRPFPFVMHPINQSIHGISIAQLDDAPTFGELWPKILPYIDEQIVVAHNCSFDLDKLDALISHYGLNYNIGDFFCTMEACKNLWPNTSPSLLNMSEIFGITIDHHEALSDAKACAILTIKLARLTNAATVQQILTSNVNKSGFKRPEKQKVEKDFYRNKHHNGDAVISFEFQEVDLNGWSWKEKRVVISGLFEQFEREELSDLLKEKGAIVVQSISGVTDVLLVGTNMGPSKLEKAKKLNIMIMSEEDFCKSC
jgi:DNA polymerase-3 subunit epsilon